MSIFDIVNCEQRVWVSWTGKIPNQA